MHKLVHAWGQDRLEADGQQQLSSLVLELMADATAEDQIDRPQSSTSVGAACDG